MRLKCEGLGVRFASSNGGVPALADVSFETRSGEFVSVVGLSGCGKTTLLRAIAGLVPVEAGSIERIASHPEGASRILTVFQENNLFPWMTALENAAFGLELMRVPKPERERRALEILHRFGFRGREDAYPHQLSMGMKQRVAVMRCFLCNPDLLLLDEPFGSLDALTRLTLQEELLGLWEREQKSVIMVTHDLDEAIRLSDRVLVMSAGPGRIVAEHRIPFGRPRPLSMTSDRVFQDLKAQMLLDLGIDIGHGVTAG